MTSASLMHETGHSKPVLWYNPEGWDGREVGGGFRMGDTCAPVADSCQCMAKATTCRAKATNIVISLQLK